MFEWGDAFRANDNYFDDVPRTSLFGGFRRSLQVALFPWASRRVPSGLRFSARRSIAVSLAAFAVWHLVATAWVMVMQLGWLLPWGVSFDRPLTRIVLAPWLVNWGFITSGTKNGAMTMSTMGGDGMAEPLWVASCFWLIGILTLGVAMLGKRTPGGGPLWLRAAIRSLPAIGGLALIMSGEWIVVATLDAWMSPSQAASGPHGIVTTLAGAALMVATPVFALWLLWSRHVRDMGVFKRPWMIVAAMILTPILLFIGGAMIRGA